MSFKEYLKEMAASYFMIVTLIDLAMLLMGISMEKDVRFGYEAFLLPLLYGFLGVLPSLVLYSRKELSILQLMLRKILQLCLLELVLLSFLYINGLRDVKILLAVACSIIIICGVVSILFWLLDLKKSSQLTRKLKDFQGRKQQENRSL